MPALGLGRERPADYINISKTIADTYPSGLAHGLQKDAIQNSVDARSSKSLPIKVEFNVVRNANGVFLTITDSNTTGLTGDVIHDIEDYRHLQRDDHWARFESFAFTKVDADALGARGQGKFIFLYASQNHKMFYDTLRKDSIYRLGATQATDIGCPIFPGSEEKPWESHIARERLSEHCGLVPLREIGTRVIICAPKQEVLDAIDSGEMERAIQETWFRLIQKKQLEVTLHTKGQIKTIELPNIYTLPQNDSSTHKVWIYGQDFNEREIKLLSGENYKIKNFHVVYLKKETVPEDLQGITLVQNGMKITSLPMAMAPTDIKEKITGYIEFGRDLDRELRKGKNQLPNHYDLKWRSALPRSIKAFITNQLDAFGTSKLGLGEDPRQRKNRRRNDAEDWAMRQLQQYARDLNLLGPHKPRPGSDPPRPPIPPPHKDRGLSFKDFLIPNEGFRVNWGQQVTFSLWGFNKTSEAVEYKISLRVLHADSEIVKLLDSESLTLDANSRKQISDSSFTLAIEKPQYENVGEYRVKATLINAETGEEVDTLTRKFWVESNPPMRQPFELKASLFPPDLTLAWSADVNNMMLLYNTNHPEYRSAEKNEDTQTDYLLKICLEGALHFVLAKTFEDAPDYAPLDTNTIMQSDKDIIPEKTYAEVMAYISKIRWKIYEDGS